MVSRTFSARAPTSSCTAYVLMNAKDTKFLKVDTVRKWRKLDLEKLARQAAANPKQRKTNQCNPDHPELEKRLHAAVMARVSAALPRSRKWVIDEARKLRDELQIDREDFRVSVGWFYKFCRRHALRLKKKTTNKLLGAWEFIKARKQWIKHERRNVWNAFIDKEGKVRHDEIFNTDEVPLVPLPLSKKQVVPNEAVVVQLRTADTTVDASKRFATLLPFLRADGYRSVVKANCVPPVLILKGKPSKTEQKFYDSLKGHVKVTWNARAWISKESWEQVIEHFRKNTKKIPEPLLYVDNCSTHITMDALRLASKHGFRQRQLVANTTHFMQPVDQHIGRFFQSKLQARFEELQEEQAQSVLANKEVKRLNLSEMRQMTAKCVSDTWKELLQTRTSQRYCCTAGRTRES